MTDLSKRIAALSPDRRALLATRLGILDEGPRERPREPVAIVGIGCRFPGGADTPERLWRLLSDGVDAVTEVPAERWAPSRVGPGDPGTQDGHLPPWGGFLTGLDGFEPSFFAISPRETASMDPQQRLFLEVAWEALENAGQIPSRLAGSRTGVYVGVHGNDYSWSLFRDASALSAYSSTGTAHSIVANRLSYVLDLRGPSIAVDTACSSSLVAVHLASQALRDRECDLALAGGVNVLLSPLWTVALSKFGMLSSDGRCKAFDTRANGIVRSEGCGVVVLKRLTDALADGDHIWGVIRGTAANQDGRSNGLTAPSGPAQQAVIRQALADAGVDGAAIDAVETHGTGTPLGDPVEVEALATVLGTGDRPCLLGAIKTNIGHCEAAAGIAGLIRIVLSLRYEAVPAPVHLRELNPHIQLHGTRLAIPRALQAWPRGDRPRLAGVSAFGFGGTNAHVVVEEPPAPLDGADAPDRTYLLPISARGTEGLRALALAFQERLADGDQDVELGDLCASAALRRVHYPYRLAVTGTSRDELLRRLVDTHGAMTPTAADPPGRLAFVFCGQGAQWPGMGRELLTREPVFRQRMEECDELVRSQAGWSLLDVLEHGDETRLGRTEIAQPALFAVQVGVAAVLATWGIVPDAVAGHSVGEIAAAHVAGALRLADALRIVVQRGRLMQRAEGRGRMVSVELPEADALRVIGAMADRVSIAAVNAPETTVLAGDSAALASVIEELERRSIGYQWLPVPYAFHSPQMDALREPLVEALDRLAPSRPRLPLVSTVTGRLVADEDLTPDYWGRNLREPVRLAAAIDTLGGLNVTTIVELGPHPVLGGAMTRTLEARGHSGIALASLRRGQPADRALVALTGRLWERGHAVDWETLYPGPRRWIPLPPTPWEREPHPARVTTPAAFGATDMTPAGARAGVRSLLARRLHTAQPTYETRLDIEAPPYLSDHRINGAAILPAAALIEMALQAGTEALAAARVRLEDLVIHRPIPLDGGLVQLTITATADPGEVAEVRIFSCPGGPGADSRSWILHASGRVRPDEAAPEPVVSEARRAGEALRATTPVTRDAHYEQLERTGAEFGPAFRGLRRLWRREGEVLAETELPPELEGPDARPRIHPALLDACLQAVAGVRASDEPTVLMPFGAEAVRVCGVSSRAWSYAQVRRHGENLTADVVVTDDSGRLLAELRGLVFRPARDRIQAPPELRELIWQPRRLPAANGSRPPGRWLILMDRSGVGDGLIRCLQSHGHTTTLLEGGVMLPPTPAEPWSGVVDLRALDATIAEDADGVIVHTAAVNATAGALALVQTLDASPAPRLWLVTRGAQSVGTGITELAVAQAPLWGFGRTVALERPELRTTLIDLDPTPGDASADALAEELLGEDSESHVAWRSRIRYVARLVACVGGTHDAPGTGWSLEVAPRGVLDHLIWVPAKCPRPGPGQVAIEVEAIGLNFRDVLNALGMYPGEAGPLGSEFAGRVAACGDGVDAPAVGTRVMGVGVGTFATSVVTDAALVVPVPSGLAPEAAATIPIAFLTAFHALHELAGIRRGQRVLIHAAAGGVGLAAVALAQRAGAEIYATAGSEEKRALLLALGVPNVMDSRSLDFAEVIATRTGGRGVDVVLNSLTGDFIPASLEVTARGGSFIEIGRRGIWDPERLASARPDVAYHVLYLGDLFERQPARIQALLRTLASDVQTGQLQPLPHRVFPATGIVDAFRFMAQARHIGKVVVIPPAPAAATVVRNDGSYLITGGLGALGIRTAEWLHARGARHLALMGRSAASPATGERLARLRREGAEIRVIQGDAGCEEDVRRTFAEIARTMPPLRGVIHAAGLVDDAVLERQSRASLDIAAHAKIAGAWNLHAHCDALPLDFFILYSSIASILGSAGQANYAAANAFLDALAAHRRAGGQHGLAVSWGSWSEDGMAARLAEHHRRRWNARGVHSLAPATALAAMERALGTDRAHVVVAAVAWGRYGGAVLVGPPEVSSEPARRAAAAVSRPALLLGLEGLPVARRSAAVLAHVREEVIRVLQLAPGGPLDLARGLKDLGLDSLMAVELRNRLQASTGRVLPTTVAFDYPSVTALAQYLERQLLGPSRVPPPVKPSRVEEDDPAAAVQRLSDDEAEQLLVEELTRVHASTRGMVDHG